MSLLLACHNHGIENLQQKIKIGDAKKKKNFSWPRYENIIKNDYNFQCERSERIGTYAKYLFSPGKLKLAWLINREGKKILASEKLMKSGIATFKDHLNIAKIIFK